jgi:hypothetical protein
MGDREICLAQRDVVDLVKQKRRLIAESPSAELEKKDALQKTASHTTNIAMTARNPIATRCTRASYLNKLMDTGLYVS